VFSTAVPLTQVSVLARASPPAVHRSPFAGRASLPASRVLRSLGGRGSPGASPCRLVSPWHAIGRASRVLRSSRMNCGKPSDGIPPRKPGSPGASPYLIDWRTNVWWRLLKHRVPARPLRDAIRLRFPTPRPPAASARKIRKRDSQNNCTPASQAALLLLLS
jgi:hypothetical protein